MSLNFIEICRVCLGSDKQTFNIFSSFSAKRKILFSEMLSECTKIKPYEGDNLPHLICKDCTRQLKRTHTFTRLCDASDKKLRDILDSKESKNLKEILDVNSQSFLDASVQNHSALSKPEIAIKLEPTDDKSLIKNVEESKSEEKHLELKTDIKLEQFDDVDDCWDADDDLHLGEIKAKKDDIDLQDTIKPEKKKHSVEKKKHHSHTKTTNELKEKKKRGRKKKVLQEGESLSKSPHQCDVCGKVLSTKSNLKAHKICHTDLRPYKCEDCAASFRGYSALFQHKKVHSGETPYHCEFCPKQFSRRTGLVNHIRVHTGEKRYSCDICFKTFTQSAQLSIHVKRHQGDKTFLCQDCGKGFPIRGDLKVHQRIHNGEKPYSCIICPKTFATSGNLSIHVRIHNKEIRYKCKECSRGFVTASAYNVHVKRHKGQRDYLCECGKTFYTSSALKQHRVVHTGEKKYQCKICERKFTQTSHLSRHFKRDHVKIGQVNSSESFKLILPYNLGDKSIFQNLSSSKIVPREDIVQFERPKLNA